MALLQFLFLVTLAALASLALAQVAVPSVRFDFNLATDTYNDLSRKLRTHLLKPSTPEYNPREVRDRYVLGPRRPVFRGAPLRWLMIHVVFGRDETTLAVAADDLYLLGFTNRSNHWHILRDFSGLPNATVLSFTENYGALIPGGHKNLFKVPLGNQSAIQAVKTLANYHPAITTKAQVTEAMVRFVVMFSEAMRFREIRDMFSQRWNKQTFITPQQAKYVVVWGSLSRLLVRWKISNWSRWDGEDAQAASGAGINGPEQAWLKVDFLLRPLYPVQDDFSISNVSH